MKSAIPSEEYGTWYWQVLDDLRSRSEGFYIHHPKGPYFVAGLRLEGQDSAETLH